VFWQRRLVIAADLDAGMVSNVGTGNSQTQLGVGW
jgi:hypothetical protein